MLDRSSHLEARLAELTESLQRLEGRVSALERAAPARRPAAASSPRRPAKPQSEVADITRGLSLVGRTLLVLAGAFVLRALTEAGTLPAWLGVGLGFAYAGTWIALADVSGRAGRALSAGFHGVAAVVIGFPLLFEATSRFRLFSPAVAAGTLTVFTAVGLGVAARRRLEGLAWLVSLGGVPTAIALILVGGRLAAPTLYLVLLGVATLWLGYVRDWHTLRWPIALATDLVVAIMAVRVVQYDSPEGPRAALLVQFVLMALYLGSITLRTLLLKRGVVPFEVVQTAAAIVVGLGGASYVAARSGLGAAGFGVGSMALGIAAYAVAFAFVERQQKSKANFYFYTSVAIVFVLAGTALLLTGGALPLTWAALAVGAGWLAQRQKRLTLRTHSAIYAVAAAVSSGLLGSAVEAAVGSPTASWAAGGPVALVVLVAMAASAWLTGSAAARSTTLERAVQLLLFAALALSVAGVLIGWLVTALAGGTGTGANLGAVATVRTAVLAGGVVLLAWLGRRDTWLEAGWLAYPLLVAIGIKILLEDLPRGRPATLVLGFAFYGAALILVPRLRHRRAGTPPAAASTGSGTPPAS